MTKSICSNIIPTQKIKSWTKWGMTSSLYPKNSCNMNISYWLRHWFVSFTKYTLKRTRKKYLCMYRRRKESMNVEWFLFSFIHLIFDKIALDKPNICLVLWNMYAYVCILIGFLVFTFFHVNLVFIYWMDYIKKSPW